MQTILCVLLAVSASFGTGPDPQVDAPDPPVTQKAFKVVLSRLDALETKVFGQPVAAFVTPEPTAAPAPVYYAAPVAMDCSSGTCRPASSGRRGLFGRRWR